MSSENETSRRNGKSTRQVAIERSVWVVLLLLISPMVIPAVEEFLEGHWFWLTIISVILVIAIAGYVFRWGLILPCTLGFAWFGLLPKVNSDTASELQSGIVCAIFGAIIGACVDGMFFKSNSKHRPIRHGRIAESPSQSRDGRWR